MEGPREPVYRDPGRELQLAAARGLGSPSYAHRRLWNRWQTSNSAYGVGAWRTGGEAGIGVCRDEDRVSYESRNI